MVFVGYFPIVPCPENKRSFNDGGIRIKELTSAEQEVQDEFFKQMRKRHGGKVGRRQSHDDEVVKHNKENGRDEDELVADGEKVKTGKYGVRKIVKRKFQHEVEEQNIL